MFISQKYSICVLIGTHFPKVNESLPFVYETINFSTVSFILERKKYFCCNYFLVIWRSFKLFPNTSGRVVLSSPILPKPWIYVVSKKKLDALGHALLFYVCKLETCTFSMPIISFDLIHSAKQWNCWVQHFPHFITFYCKTGF